MVLIRTKEAVEFKLEIIWVVELKENIQYNKKNYWIKNYLKSMIKNWSKMKDNNYLLKEKWKIEEFNNYIPSFPWYYNKHSPNWLMYKVWRVKQKRRLRKLLLNIMQIFKLDSNNNLQHLNNKIMLIISLFNWMAVLLQITK